MTTAPSRSGAIALQNVRFAYPGNTFGIHVATLDVPDRERLALVGPSGSGKSTLLHLVAGVLRPNYGSVQVAETRVDALSDRARRDFRLESIGFVFQDFALIDYLDVLGNIMLPYFVSPRLRLDGAVRDRAAVLAESVGIADKLRRAIGALSQGERQRVALCRALITQPGVILADEPTGNLDPANKRRCLDVMFTQAADHGATFVAVTHDREVLGGFDRVVDVAGFHAGDA